MQSSLPARGRSVAVAALAALLLAAAADAGADDGGFSAVQVAPIAAPALTASINPDGRTALAPAGAPPEVVAAIAAANRITRKPYKWGGGHGRWRDAATTAPAACPTCCTRPACCGERTTRAA